MVGQQVMESHEYGEGGDIYHEMNIVDLVNMMLR